MLTTNIVSSTVHFHSKAKDLLEHDAFNDTYLQMVDEKMTAIGLEVKFIHSLEVKLWSTLDAWNLSCRFQK